MTFSVLKGANWLDECHRWTSSFMDNQRRTMAIQSWASLLNGIWWDKWTWHNYSGQDRHEAFRINPCSIFIANWRSECYQWTGWKLNVKNARGSHFATARKCRMDIVPSFEMPSEKPQKHTSLWLVLDKKPSNNGAIHFHHFQQTLKSVAERALSTRWKDMQ